MAQVDWLEWKMIIDVPVRGVGVHVASVHIVGRDNFTARIVDAIREAVEEACSECERCCTGAIEEKIIEKAGSGVARVDVKTYCEGQYQRISQTRIAYLKVEMQVTGEDNEAILVEAIDGSPEKIEKLVRRVGALADAIVDIASAAKKGRIGWCDAVKAVEAMISAGENYEYLDVTMRKGRG